MPWYGILGFVGCLYAENYCVTSCVFLTTQWTMENTIVSLSLVTDNSDSAALFFNLSFATSFSVQARAVQFGV